MPQEGTEHRKLTAIMFTDMVGYSALAERNEELALELLEEHRRLLRSIFPKHRGSEIKTIGDGFLAEFSSALAAVQCGIEIQEMIAKRNSVNPSQGNFQVRIGIHAGDVVHRDDDVIGDGGQYRRSHRTIGRSGRHLYFPASLRPGRESRRQVAEKDGAGETEEYDATSGGLWRGMRGRSARSAGSHARQQIF